MRRPPVSLEDFDFADEWGRLSPICFGNLPFINAGANSFLHQFGLPGPEPLGGFSFFTRQEEIRYLHDLTSTFYTTRWAALTPHIGDRLAIGKFVGDSPVCVRPDGAVIIISYETIRAELEHPLAQVTWSPEEELYVNQSVEALARSLIIQERYSEVTANQSQRSRFKYLSRLQDVLWRIDRSALTENGFWQRKIEGLRLWLD